ncbi:Zinc-binding alcohol dehydrogenase domain-containing protein 2 [Phytophthora nicotianae]|nr:Zinc-binding alcohol dehydrogenase domain-containing protein 2 [Phytophthora nicotianae]
MADTTALILVPSLLTLLAVFEKPGSALAVLQDQTNLWLRCVCMFIGRLGGSFLAREIFTCKLRSRLRSSPEDLGDQPDPISGSIDGMSARLWIQQLMLQDFHAQFWYLTAVTVVVIFGCFARIDLPLRFALL